MQCLLSLCDGVQHLGAVYQPRQQETIASMVLRPLIDGWLQDAWVELDDQLKHDVAFIKQLASLYGQTWADLTQALADKLSSAVSVLEGGHDRRRTYLFPSRCMKKQPWSRWKRGLLSIWPEPRPCCQSSYLGPYPRKPPFCSYPSTKDSSPH